LKRFLQALEELSSLKPDFSPLQKELESAVISISEACQMLESFEESLSPDPARLENLEGLLGKLRKHQVKYACDFEGLKRHYRDIRDQLEELRNPPSFDEHVERVRTLEKQMSASGSTLTAHRKNASGKLKRALEIELKDLDMAHARVFPRLERRHPGPSGYDQAEFFLVTNPGEDPKPLHRIVSGGELCRIMLAFKTVLAKTDDIPILIFDEIDANIGGVTAVAAGKKMRSVAEGRQVITITHQPQIASKAGTHFAVAKERTPDAARTRIRRLDENQKVEELSRMLGGDSITSVVRKHAREMIRKDSARS
jgi:DNA repair protein RecN (Recombination protein N)